MCPRLYDTHEIADNSKILTASSTATHRHSAPHIFITSQVYNYTGPGLRTWTLLQYAYTSFCRPSAFWTSHIMQAPTPSLQVYSLHVLQVGVESAGHARARVIVWRREQQNCQACNKRTSVITQTHKHTHTHQHQSSDQIHFISSTQYTTE